MIEVKNLTKRYGDHVAVDCLSFRVEKGQIYGFLGPNGAGKTTTMNILTGYIAASEGTVTIDGKDIRKEPEEAKKRIGYLPEIPPLYMDMTVEEYLHFAAQLKKVAKTERNAQVENVMEMTRIADVRRRLIRNLSKGYRQRVGLAQAVLGNPEVIILDEPTVGLDPKQIIEIRDLIRRLGENHTIILSSHILSEVSAVCDHIMIIAHGKLVASDSPERLQKRMAGSAELTLAVKGGEDRLKAVLESVPGIASVECMKAKEKGVARAKVVLREKADSRTENLPEKNTDIRETVFYALAEEKLPIMEMAASEKSLEDIFLELTADAPSKEDAGKKRFGRKKRTAKPEADTEETAESTAAGAGETAESTAAGADETAEGIAAGAGAGEAAESTAAGVGETAGAKSGKEGE